MRDRTNAGQDGPTWPLPASITYLGLGLTILLATGFRLYRLAGQSLWADEGNSAALAQAGLGEIAARTALDIHPPLYYWLLHSWLRVFGQAGQVIGLASPPTAPRTGYSGSEIGVRFLSVVTGVLLVAVIHRLGKRFSSHLGPRTSRRVGLLAAFIAAVSPFQVYYAQEARMYTLLALLGSLAVWAAAELMSYQEPATDSEGNLAAHFPFLFARFSFLYVLSATLGLYTHYAFPLVLAAVNLAFLLGWWRGRDGRRLAGWLMLQLIPLVLYLPWLPIAVRQLTTWPASPSPVDAGHAWITVWRTLVLGPIGVKASSLWLLGLGLASLAGLARLLREEPLPKSALLVLYLGLPIGLTLALFKPAYLKFLLVASPALCLLLALGLAGGRIRRANSLLAWLGAGLVAFAAWGPLKAYYFDPAVARDDYRGIANYLEAIAGPEDAIILNAAGQQEVFGFYYGGDTPVHPLPRQRPLDPEKTRSELEAITSRARRIYALYWATDESDPAGVIEGWLDERAFKATDTWIGNVRLVSYAAPLAAGDLLPIEIRLGDHIALTGYRLLRPSANRTPATSQGLSCADNATDNQLVRIEPGEIVQAQLRWTTDAPLNVRYVVFLQALDAANHLVGQRDAEPKTPTIGWKPGEPVPDHHGLFIEPGTPPGDYRVIVGLYDAATGRRLPTFSGDFVELATLVVEKPAAPLPVTAFHFQRPAHADFGPLRLLGYDRYKLGHSHKPDLPLNAGDPLHIILYWQAQSHTDTDWRISIRITPVDNPSTPIAEGVFPAAGVDYPTTRWEQGEVVRAQFDLFLPGDVKPGNYRLSLQLLDETESPGEVTFDLAPISIE